MVARVKPRRGAPRQTPLAPSPRRGTFGRVPAASHTVAECWQAPQLPARVGGFSFEGIIGRVEGYESTFL